MPIRRVALLIVLAGLALCACGPAGGPAGGPREEPAALGAPASPGPGATAPPATPAAPPLRASSVAVNDQPLLVERGTPAPAAPQLPAPSPTAPSPTAPAAPGAPGRPAASGRPARLVIAAIGLDQPVVAAGLDAQGYPVVPRHAVAWYSLSAEPGQGENIVLWGHVLRFRSEPAIPAPFARLHELGPGARIEVYDQGGALHAYVVARQVQVTPDRVEYMLPKGRERLTLISCFGDVVVEEGGVDMTHRLITVAEPEG